MKQPKPPSNPAPTATAAPAPATAPTADDPPLQGEGNYSASRRHRESVETFVAAGKVEPAARDAAPATEAEAQELIAAEKAGRSHAKR